MVYFASILACSLWLSGCASEHRISDPPVVKFALLQDGAFAINGKRYADNAALRTRIEELAAERPQPSFVIVTHKPSAMDQVMLVGRAVAILQKAGIAKVGFLIEPKQNSDTHTQLEAPGAN